ncbi:MAG: flagellar assembly protein FliW [Deltaproteobacteria bacterium]|nr:flagellar assembly protein FliW [Deltaproteobacteria bacterium]
MISPVENKPSEARSLTITTRDLGQRQVEREEIIVFPVGLPGFEDCLHFVLLEYSFTSPFLCLQSVDRPEVAFVVTDPVHLVADFSLKPGAAGLKDWNLEDPRNIRVLVILTIPPGRPRDMTANLMAPLVVNLRTHRGFQVVLDKPGYSSHHQVLRK